MKVAVATFGERVSPRFDCAQTFLVATVDEGRFSQDQQLFASGWGPHERIKRLVDLGVEAVICGGVDRRSAESLESAGVKVYARRTGKIEDVLMSLFQIDERKAGSRPQPKASTDGKAGARMTREVSDDS